MIIHLFTGSKGGIGKTRCAISLAMYYLLGGSAKPFLGQYKEVPNGYKLNVFDANSNNIDFFTIMTGKDFQILGQRRRESSINSHIKQEFLTISHKDNPLSFDGYAYIRKSPFELFQGVSDFWENVYEVAKRTKEDDERDVLIIDTNLSVPNLVSENPVQKSKMKPIFQKLKEIEVNHIVIWYIWCLNDFLSIRENLTFSTSQKIELLDKICQVDFEKTGNKINQYVIHVLNPYLFFEKSPIFKTFLTKLLSNQAFKILMEHAGIGFNLPFDMAVKILVRIISELVKDELGSSSSKWEEVMEQIGKVNETGVNIVVLSNQRENYSYIKDQLSNLSFNSNKIANLEMIHRANFGEDSLWKKLTEFHRWVRA